MSEQKPDIGSVGWVDLTVPDAVAVRDFYSKVAGWKHEGVRMGEYDDFVMITPNSNTPAAGICHKKGTNSDLPSQWLIYITVSDIEKSTADCKQLGGKLISQIKKYADMGKYCIIEDPAGAVCALFEPK